MHDERDHYRDKYHEQRNALQIANDLLHMIENALPPGPGTVVERVRAVCEDYAARVALDAWEADGGGEFRSVRRAFRVGYWGWLASEHGNHQGFAPTKAALARAMGLVKGEASSSRSVTASHAETGEKAIPGFMGYPATYREPSRSADGNAARVRGEERVNGMDVHDWVEKGEGWRQQLEDIASSLPPGPGTVVERVRAACEELAAREALEEYEKRGGQPALWDHVSRGYRVWMPKEVEYKKAPTKRALARAMGLVKDAP